jgi:hypothetical protein
VGLKDVGMLNNVDIVFMGMWIDWIWVLSED